LTGRLLS